MTLKLLSATFLHPRVNYYTIFNYLLIFSLNICTSYPQTPQGKLSTNLYLISEMIEVMIETYPLD